ncbi:uncharacterized protein Bfra_009598 [Botrytis fragariae]|uniref:Uncharacterized protein n=1 Tax=Botrytis fragariae TaxID=1964551 RepID=A0A8H6AP11_9HELO|nr:uncharacterized protein Bfra_009598 [Botrytis fragariae]KAF5871042.1 hypothetical protein Bfra_009598 [Botrytis fragariae]
MFIFPNGGYVYVSIYSIAVSNGVEEYQISFRGYKFELFPLRVIMRYATLVRVLIRLPRPAPEKYWIASKFITGSVEEILRLAKSSKTQNTLYTYPFL